MLCAIFIVFLLPIITGMWILSLLYSTFNPDFVTPVLWQWTLSFILPVLIAIYGLRKKSLNTSGAVAGLVVGFLLTISCMRFLASLLAFFVFASKATKFRASKKKTFEADFKEGGQRNWIQVISNGGPAAILAVFYMLEVGSLDLPINYADMYAASWYSIAVMSALASSSGDTFASEIGSVMGKEDPVHILTWQKVPRGTNGGISSAGTLGSIFGGFLVGAAFYIAELLTLQNFMLLDSPQQWPVVFYGAFAGFFGSMVDSVLGAVLQYSGKHKKLGIIVEHKGPDVEHISGREILDNHSVNLLPSLITGLVIPFIAAQTWTIFV